MSQDHLCETWVDEFVEASPELVACTNALGQTTLEVVDMKDPTHSVYAGMGRDALAQAQIARAQQILEQWKSTQTFGGGVPVDQPTVSSNSPLSKHAAVCWTQRDYLAIVKEHLKKAPNLDCESMYFIVMARAQLANQIAPTIDKVKELISIAQEATTQPNPKHAPENSVKSFPARALGNYSTVTRPWQNYSLHQ